ncbi:cytochrome c oxidase assembly protein [Bryobacterales bacterium F-183]|nr:cytochrome c oxidase assembly protein [Bryobacterales bacterium F-183]
MEALWFWLLALMLTTYVVLDGFDLGAGIAHLLIAKTEDERKAVLESIGPFWDGNEVWLIAAGGTLFLAFPTLYAASFMGFYLPLIIVLWLLMFRGLSIELRNHAPSPMWLPLWDVCFAGSSALLAVFLGAALGNVVRGVPLDAQQEFFLPLWTDFQPGREPGILDWYTVTVGATAFCALWMHGLLWVERKTSGTLSERASAMARRVALGVAVLTVVVTAATFVVRPEMWQRFADAPWGLVFPVAAVAGLGTVMAGKRPFAGSATYLVGMMLSAAFSLFPVVLPSSTDPALHLTIYNTASGAYSQSIALWWWIPGIVLTTGYFTMLFRKFGSKVS